MSKETRVSKEELDKNMIDKAIGKLQALRVSVTEGSVSLVDGRVEDTWNLLQVDDIVSDVLSIDIEYTDNLPKEPNPKNE